MFSRNMIGLVASLGIFCSATAADLKLLAPNAAKDSVTEAIAVFEKLTGHTVVVTWAGTEAITKRVAEGEPVDVIVNASQNIDRLVKDGKLVGTTRTDFARSGIGVAIPASASKVDISSPQALKAALQSARTVVVSSGTSGRHMVEVFSKLGVGEQVKSKLKQPPSGAQISDFLAAGEADIGFQQVSELLHVKGIQYLGPVPTDLQNYTIYSAALHVNARSPEAAKALLSALRAPSTAAAVRASGMEAL